MAGRHSLVLKALWGVAGRGVFVGWGLFEVVVEVAGDALVEVDALVAHHVVALAGIDVEVGLGTGGDTGFKEAVGVLGHNGGVVEADDDLQAAFEVGSAMDAACASVAFGVGLRGVHVALTIHDLVPLPVDDGTAGYADYEDIGMVGHQADGHESAEAPSVHTDAGCVDVGKRLEVVDAAHLVAHLHLSELAEGGLLEVASPVLAAPVVEDEEEVAALGHVGLPTAAGVVPACVDVVGVGAAVDVDHGGIALGGVEADGHHHAVVEVGDAVVGLEGAAAVVGHGVALPGVGGGEVTRGAGGAGVDDGDVAGHVGLLVAVDDVLAAGAEDGVVPSAATFIDTRNGASGDVDAEDVALDGVELVGGEDDGLLLLVEADHFHDHPLAAGELLELMAVGVVDVEVVVTVFLALHDELAAVPGQEDDGMLRLDVLRARLAIDALQPSAGGGVVADELAIVLVAVELEHVDGGSVGTPGHVGEIAVGGVAGAQIEGVASGHVEDANLHDVRRLPGHGILLGRRSGDDVGRVVDLRHGDEGIVGDHALVHAVEGEACALRVPEEAAFDAELVAVHTLSIDDVARAVGGHLPRVAVSIGDEEVVVVDESHCSACVAPLAGLHAGGALLAPLHLATLDVDEHALLGIGDEQHRLVGIGENCRGERHQVEGVDLSASPFVELGAGEEYFLGELAALGRADGPAGVGVHAHELVAHPPQGAVLRNHVAVVVTTEIQVFECELFLCLCPQCQQSQCEQKRGFFHHVC